MRGIRTASAAALAFVVAACGSTVEVVDGQGTSGEHAAVDGGADAGGRLAVDDGLALDSTTTSGISSSASGTSTTTSSSTAGASSDTSAAAPRSGSAADAPGSSSAPRPTGSGPAPGTSGRGYTADEIRIGVGYTQNAGAANENAGLEGASGGDDRAYAELMMERLNADGGLFGRRVVPVWYGYDGTGTTDFRTQEQAACARWTQDTEVFAVLTVAEETLIGCLAKAGVPLISSQGKRDADHTLYDSFPMYVEVSNLSMDVVAQLHARGLHAQGYYEPVGPAGEVVLGLVRYDLPGYRRVVRRTLRPELARLGIEIAAEAEISAPYGLNDYGTVTQQVSSAVLNFQRRGVTHVIFMESRGDLALFWMQTAESQGYRPRYGLTSNDAGEVLAANVPHAQLEHALAVGWSPTIDFTESNAPGSWPALEECRRIFAEAGYEFEDRNAEAIAMLECDSWRLLQFGGRRAPEFSQPGLVAGIERLGRSFPMAANPYTAFGPDRHFGVSGFYHYAWSTDCECFKMTSDWLATPS